MKYQRVAISEGAHVELKKRAGEAGMTMIDYLMMLMDLDKEIEGVPEGLTDEEKEQYRSVRDSAMYTSISVPVKTAVLLDFLEGRMGGTRAGIVHRLFADKIKTW